MGNHVEPEPEPEPKEPELKPEEEWEKIELAEEEQEQEAPGDAGVAEGDRASLRPTLAPRVARALTRPFIPTPAHVGGPPKTPAEILSKKEQEPPANDLDAHRRWAARDHLRFFARSLRWACQPADNPTSRKIAARMDTLILPYRGNINEFLNIMAEVDKRLIEVEALENIEKAVDEKERDSLRKEMGAKLGAIDSWLSRESAKNLRTALDEWLEQRRAENTDWEKLQKTEFKILGLLEKFAKEDVALGNRAATARLGYLEGIGREIGRQASEHFAGGEINFGAPLDGVASRVRLASQSEVKSEEYRTRIEEYRVGKGRLAAKGLSLMIQNEFGFKTVGPAIFNARWRAELIDAIRNWEQEIKNFADVNVRDLAKLKRTSEELLAKIIEARNNVTSIPGNTELLRNLNCLLVVASGQLQDRVKEGGARASYALSGIIKTLGKAVAPAEAAPDPLSDFWTSKKDGALGKLSQEDQQKINKWFSVDLSGKLDNWINTLNGDAAKIAAESEDMLNALLRCRDVVNTLVANPGTRVELSAAIESLRIAISNKLEKANERFKKDFV